MAKKHSVTSGEDKSSKRQGSKKTVRSAGPKPAAQKGPPSRKPPSAAAAKPTFAPEQIGTTAGQVWHALSERDGLTLSALKKTVDAPGDLVMAAVGWLAREGKLRFTPRGRSVKLSLH